MFNQQEYITDFIKNTYKTVKLRNRNDDKIIINKNNSVDNINRYLIGLITKDIFDNRKYNYINNDELPSFLGDEFIIKSFIIHISLLVFSTQFQ